MDHLHSELFVSGTQRAVGMEVCHAQLKPFQVQRFRSTHGVQLSSTDLERIDAAGYMDTM